VDVKNGPRNKQHWLVSGRPFLSAAGQTPTPSPVRPQPIASHQTGFAVNLVRLPSPSPTGSPEPSHALCPRARSRARPVAERNAEIYGECDPQPARKRSTSALPRRFFWAEYTKFNSHRHGASKNPRLFSDKSAVGNASLERFFSVNGAVRRQSSYSSRAAVKVPF